jgi:WXXGXW repeat (2 copies)
MMRSPMLGWPKKIRSLVLAASLLALPASSFGGVFVSVSIAPPVLPVYAQPICPGPDYIWTPGYWAYGPDGYFWVPGTWVVAPRAGLLWTPGYWGFAAGVYGWHAGFWGPHVGFYGGVNYGFGYGGVGFGGGMWVGGHFSYNTAVANVNATVIHNTYVNRSVVVNNVNHVSFNGAGGITARPNSAEMAAAREQHIAATSVQASHERAAGLDRSNFASVNHGRPANMAMAHPMTPPAGHANQQAAAHHNNAPPAKKPEPANHESEEHR